jgi:hypothetical protein
MRGGNRQRPTSNFGAKVPRAPRDLNAREAAVWRELARAVEALGTYQPSDMIFFRLTVRTVAEAEAPGDMPPTARARVLQAAGSMLNAFGLSPLSRERVKPVIDSRSPHERILAIVDGGGR